MCLSTASGRVTPTRILHTKPTAKAYVSFMTARMCTRDWQCVECGACGAASSEQPLRMIDCDDCGQGPVCWVNDFLEERGYSVRIDRDSPLDAPSVNSRTDLRSF
jgi:hypothetical protein